MKPILLFFLLSLLFGFSNAFCGDLRCDPYSGETSVSCPDCYCGDNICDFSEYFIICPDCPRSCGNLVCDSNENSVTCPIDCGENFDSCGNLQCDIGETTVNCFNDCPTQASSTPILYTLYVFNTQSNYLYTCNVTVIDVSGIIIDEYKMAVVASGKTVPTGGTYFITALCDNHGSAAQWVYLDPSTSGMTLNFPLQVCGDTVCADSESASTCPEDCGAICTPKCSGKICGDDGCGGSCGTCSVGQTCLSGVCISSCTPNCQGRTCGDNGCGGSCGSCPFGQTCSSNGQCVTSCTPNCNGRNCGDNGCGGSCGACSFGQTCQNGICITTCTPNCNGKNCGDNGCGGSCGACSSGQTCNNGVCSSIPCSPNCSGRNCGDNGCGGSCGTCSTNQFCSNGICVSSCTPNCSGRNCGDNGCGGSCGSCSNDQSCVNGLCTLSCTPNCSGRNCGDNGCGGSCGTCGFGLSCVSGLCINTCTPSCSGRTCGDNGCGGSCGTCPSGLSCVNGQCSNVTCLEGMCEGKGCGPAAPGCDIICGLCGYGEYCDSQGMCISNWTIGYYLTGESGACPSTAKTCINGSNALIDLVPRLKTGDNVVVSPGYYCGGFTIGTEGVRLTGEPGAVIVPCSSQWWDPAPPNCQAVDGASGTPCSLANSLVTVNASSVTISGFEFNGKVPNPLFAGSPGIQVYSEDGTSIGAARAIANWVPSSGRTFVQFPIITLLISNNTFQYFEESGVRIKRSTVTIQDNVFSRIGTIGAAIDRRQAKTEKTRGSRKDKPGAGVVLDESAGGVISNDMSGCDYGGMSGGEYPPSSFPSKKRSIDSRDMGSQYDYELVQWARNTIRDVTFGGFIVESMKSGTQRIFGNIMTGESGRGLIVEDNSAQAFLEIRENSIQGMGMASWVWKTDSSTFYRENYQSVETGLHLISCNPYETFQPLAGSTINATETQIESAGVAFWVQDEPASNPLCSASGSIFLTLVVEGGLISDALVGLQTSGNRLDASSVSIFTDDLQTKTVVKSNSVGVSASSQQVAPPCPPTCSGHGSCAGINICDCADGYHDYDCSLEVCGDKYCTLSETPDLCPTDCLFRIRKSSITLQFGGLVPEPSCCSIPSV